MKQSISKIFVLSIFTCFALINPALAEVQQEVSSPVTSQDKENASDQSNQPKTEESIAVTDAKSNVVNTESQSGNNDQQSKSADSSNLPVSSDKDAKLQDDRKALNVKLMQEAARVSATKTKSATKSEKKPRKKKSNFKKEDLSFFAQLSGGGSFGSTAITTKEDYSYDLSKENILSVNSAYKSPFASDGEDDNVSNASEQPVFTAVGKDVYVLSVNRILESDNDGTKVEENKYSLKKFDLLKNDSSKGWYIESGNSDYYKFTSATKVDSSSYLSYVSYNNVKTKASIPISISHNGSSATDITAYSAVNYQPIAIDGKPVMVNIVEDGKKIDMDNSDDEEYVFLDYSNGSLEGFEGISFNYNHFYYEVNEGKWYMYTKGSGSDEDALIEYETQNVIKDIDENGKFTSYIRDSETGEEIGTYYKSQDSYYYKVPTNFTDNIMGLTAVLNDGEDKSFDIQLKIKDKHELVLSYGFTEDFDVESFKIDEAITTILGYVETIIGTMEKELNSSHKYITAFNIYNTNINSAIKALTPSEDTESSEDQLFLKAMKVGTGSGSFVTINDKQFAYLIQDYLDIIDHCFGNTGLENTLFKIRKPGKPDEFNYIAFTELTFVDYVSFVLECEKTTNSVLQDQDFIIKKNNAGELVITGKDLSDEDKEEIMEQLIIETQKGSAQWFSQNALIFDDSTDTLKFDTNLNVAVAEIKSDDLIFDAQDFFSSTLEFGYDEVEDDIRGLSNGEYDKQYYVAKPESLYGDIAEIKKSLHAYTEIDIYDIYTNDDHLSSQDSYASYNQFIESGIFETEKSEDFFAEYYQYFEEEGGLVEDNRFSDTAEEFLYFASYHGEDSVKVSDLNSMKNSSYQESEYDKFVQSVDRYYSLFASEDEIQQIEDIVLSNSANVQFSLGLKYRTLIGSTYLLNGFKLDVAGTFYTNSDLVGDDNYLGTQFNANYYIGSSIRLGLSAFQPYGLAGLATMIESQIYSFDFDSYNMIGLNYGVGLSYVPNIAIPVAIFAEFTLPTFFGDYGLNAGDANNIGDHQSYVGSNIMMPKINFGVQIGV